MEAPELTENSPTPTPVTSKKGKILSIISLPQVITGALSAITVSFLSLQLGVSGTIIGAGIGSIMGTVSTAIYSTSINKGTHVVKKSIKRPQAEISDKEQTEETTSNPVEVNQPFETSPVLLPWYKRVAWSTTLLSTGIALALALGAVSLYESKKVAELTETQASVLPSTGQHPQPPATIAPGEGGTTVIHVNPTEKETVVVTEVKEVEVPSDNIENTEKDNRGGDGAKTSTQKQEDLKEQDFSSDKTESTTNPKPTPSQTKPPAKDTPTTKPKEEPTTSPSQPDEEEDNTEDEDAEDSPK